MAYAIEHGETISAAMPRIVIERIDSAYEQLRDERESPAVRVHNARKRFKEVRAGLRLIRVPLAGQFAVENVWFRDAGRELAALRDADAVLEAAEDLLERADGFHERRVARRVRRRLKRRRGATDVEARITRTAQQLPVAKARVTLWPRLDDSFATIGDGLRRSYRDGRRSFRRAMEQPAPATIHEWRKRVKDHWYHAQILRHVWPDGLKSYREQIEELSRALGNRHDLDVLRQIVLDDGFGNDFDARVLKQLLDSRADELTEKAFDTGTRIYAERPAAVTARFERYWNAWHD